jgi:hypothetical protein
VVAAGVAVGVGVGGAGGGLTTRAGAAGVAVRARGRVGAVTVTTGTEIEGVVCGVACGVSGGVCGACGVVCGACGAGVSEAGGVVVGGVSDGVGGVCDEALPATQSATNAELLRRSKRLLEIDMTPPKSLTGTTSSAPKIDASRRNDAAWWCPARPSLARGRAGTRSISGGGWCARRLAAATLTLCGHVSGAPSGDLDQSLARTRALISPPSGHAALEGPVSKPTPRLHAVPLASAK